MQEKNKCKGRSTIPPPPPPEEERGQREEQRLGEGGEGGCSSAGPDSWPPEKLVLVGDRPMARNPCDLRILLLAAAAAFIYIQLRLFTTQSHYADRLAQAEKSENQCTSELRSLIDQVSMQQEKIVALEEMKIRQDEERVHLKILIQDLESMKLLTL
ncbi:hypothetical protein GUJ93_ZPchr0002g26248 [Zizania palustris]|uniref:Alpha-1,3-mannosyl-glycoprotein 2-beta-N-acetylglucosaminyltransferase n=1 Tax=Zizania palustris TaxID=103762 RepID=A0A8J5S020_ZIZPA|nr:hypothetical protein GUJ93_ZPchr0002g26248 [Zizania palustris]